MGPEFVAGLALGVPIGVILTATAATLPRRRERPGFVEIPPGSSAVDPAPPIRLVDRPPTLDDPHPRRGGRT